MSRGHWRPRVILSCVVLALAGYAIVRRPEYGVNDLLPAGRGFAGVVLGLLVAVLLALWVVPRAGRVVRILCGAGAAVATLLLLMIGWGRYREWQFDRSGTGLPVWPPEAARSHAGRVDELRPAERARWGALVATSLLADTSVDRTPLVVPATWPFPGDVEIAVRDFAPGHVEVWARAADGTAACIPVPWRARAGDSLRQATECDGAHAAPAGLAFGAPVRRPAETRQAAGPGTGARWEQYRGDARRSGHGPDAIVTPVIGWRAAIDGPVRASTAIAGRRVMIGAHRTGALEVLDLATGAIRWTARLPNWVHQDPVTDGRILAVGFGDNEGSMGGRTPSGVAAFDLENGTPLWTVFDETSVMTSAVLSGSTITYASAAGVLRIRRLDTGELLSERQLPGGVIMAPPAVRGDSMVVSLDHNRVCLLLPVTRATAWCTHFPGMRKVGHAAPTLAGDLVIANGLVLLRDLSLREFLAQHWRDQLSLLWNAFGPDAPEIGQRNVGLDLATGQVRWRGPLAPHLREVLGHTSGTATIADSIAVIVMPYSDSLVAFSPADGSTRWTAPAHAARGPPLILDGQVLLRGRDGIIEIRDVLSGTLRCTITRDVGFDRAAPSASGGLAVSADLNGGIEAIPVADLLACRGEGTRRPAE